MRRVSCVFSAILPSRSYFTVRAGRHRLGAASSCSETSKPVARLEVVDVERVDLLAGLDDVLQAVDVEVLCRARWMHLPISSAESNSTW